MKKRITLTLEEALLKNVDSRVDGLNVRNRSHAIELMITKLLETQKLRKALILGGGKGTRLRPFTYEVPKPLIPLHGKPIVEHLISNLKKSGVEEVLLSIGYMSEKIISALGTGENLGVKLEYVVEQKELGTAGCLKLAKNKLTETFAMMNGDVLSKLDFQEMYKFHKETGSLATIALVPVDDPALKYGVVKLKGNQIVSFIEKPSKSEVGNLINAGMYIIEPEVVKYVPNGFAMMEKDVFPKLAKEGKLSGYTYTGPWADTGTTENYEKAIKEWKS